MLILVCSLAVGLTLTLPLSIRAASGAIRLALITDPSNELSVSLPDLSLFRVNDSSNATANFKVRKFGQIDNFVSETITACPFSVVIALANCVQNVHLYEHLRTFCPDSILLTLYESTCQRPPRDLGIGISHLNSVGNLTPLLADIGFALSEHWPQVTLIYQTGLDISQVDQFVNLLKSISEQSQVEIFRLSDDEFITTQSLSPTNLQTLKSLKVDIRKRLFLAIVDTVMLEKVIFASKQLSLINHANKWIFVMTEKFSIDLLSDQVKDILSESDILLMQNVRDQDCSALKLDCMLELVEDSLLKAVDKVLNNSSYNLEDGSKRQFKNRLLSEIKLLFDSDDMVKCGNCDHYQAESLIKHRTNDIVDSAKDIVQVNPNHIQFELVTQKYGAWSPFKGLILENDIDSETNLKNRPLNIGIVDQPPLIRIYRNGTNGNSSQQIVGTTYEMVLVLAAKLNFTPTFIVDYSYNLGYLQPDGSWTGMIKRVIDGEVDIGANGYWKTNDRLKAVHFTFPFKLKEIGMLVKKTDEDHKYLFLAPFTWDAWLSILITVIVMGPLLWLVHRSSKYYEYYQMQNSKGLFKLGNCVWYCFGAIIQQGGDHLPMAISGRILITFWWLFVIVTVTTYSGNLVALLTFPKIFNPINDLYDLIQYKSVLKYGVTRSSGVEEVIKDSPNTALQALTDNFVFYDSIDTDSLFDEVKKMRLVFLATDTTIRYLISEDYKKYNSCQLMIAKEPILTKSVSFVLGHDKPARFIQKIDYEVGRMAKSGLVTLWSRKYDVQGNDCLFPLLVRAGDVKKIELSHMMDCFFVLAIGVAVGLICLLVEILKRRKPNDGEDKTGVQKVGHSILIVWQKVMQVYKIVSSGKLWSSWMDRDRTRPVTTVATSQAVAQPNHLNGIPIYRNYYGYGNASGGTHTFPIPYLPGTQLRSSYWPIGLRPSGPQSNYNIRHPLANNVNRT